MEGEVHFLFNCRKHDVARTRLLTTAVNIHRSYNEYLDAAKTMLNPKCKKDCEDIYHFIKDLLE